jgi:cellulose biosynthesis protein BcsQ
MEFIEGKSLSEILESESHEEFRIAGYILDILDVLVSMHSLKPLPVIHGDIKPENILICDNRAILIDFGSVSGTSGSSGFCAPEKLAGFNSTIQSDIYSIGQVMHFCFTGKTRKLFDNNKRGIKKGLYEIIERAVRKLPTDRYVSAMEMANDLKRWTKGSSSDNQKEGSTTLLCIPGNPHLCCEMAYVTSSYANTLLADLDLLSPGIDMLMGLKKLSGSSHEYGFSVDLEAGYGIIPGKKSGRPDILACLSSYDAYEETQNGIIKRIAEIYSDIYDVIIICCSDFPYDSTLVEALFTCDNILFSVEKGPLDIRKLNSMALHFSRRQGVNIKRMNLIGYGFSEKNIDPAIAGISSEVRWLGQLPHISQRVTQAMNGMAYLPEKKSSSFKAITRILKKLEVI